MLFDFQTTHQTFKQYFENILKPSRPRILHKKVWMHVKDKKLSAHQDMYNPENNIFVAGLDLVKVVVQAQETERRIDSAQAP